MKYLPWLLPFVVCIPFWLRGNKEVRNTLVTIMLFLASGAILATAGLALIRLNIGVVLGRFHSDLGVLVSLTAMGPFGIAMGSGAASRWAHNPPSWRSIAWRLSIYTACTWTSLILSSGMNENPGLLAAGPFLWGSVLIFMVGATVLVYPAVFDANFLQSDRAH